MQRSISGNAVVVSPMGTPFFYPLEIEDVVAFQNSSALGGRIKKFDDIAHIIMFLCTAGS